MKAWALKFIPEDHGVIDYMSSCISSRHNLFDCANPSISNDPGDLFEVGVILLDAMIEIHLRRFDYTIANS